MEKMEWLKRDKLNEAMQGLDDLRDLVVGTQRSLLGSRMVNCAAANRLIDEIMNALPDALLQAKEIVRKEAEILSAAQKQAGEIVDKANAEAQTQKDTAKKDSEALRTAAKRDSDAAARLRQETKNSTEAEKKRAQQDAEQILAQARKELVDARAQAQKEFDAARVQAEQMIRSAQQEGQRLHQLAKDRANAEANGIVQEARTEADRLKMADAVHQRAVIEAGEIRSCAQQDAYRMRQDGIDYTDSVLADADAYLSRLVDRIRLELIDDLRAQRQSLQNLR